MNVSGCDSVVTANIIIGCPTVNLNMYLQGFYTGGGMMDNYGSGGCLFVNGISPNATDADTVRISLMSATSPYGLVESQTAILNTDGTVSVTFSSNVSLGVNYYIRVQQRNILETWSASPVLLNAVNSYDFTSSASQAYGSNQVDVGTPLGEPSVYAMYSGDFSDAVTATVGVQDGVIEAQDYLEMENAVYVILLGYNPQDITGDGIVEAADYLLIENNVRPILSTMRP
jgi:hypothetical protein